jgi:EAL domain-containing protein (putative c-di-GMP-specific phosphodiesterase class I)
MSSAGKPDFSMILDEGGTIQKVNGNTSIALGAAAQRVQGRPFTDFVVPEEQILTSEMISQVLMTGQMTDFMVYLQSLNGAVAAYNMAMLVAPGGQSCQVSFKQLPNIKYEPIGRDASDNLSDAIDRLLFGDLEDDLDLTFVDMGDVEKLATAELEALASRVEENLRQNAHEGNVSRIDAAKYSVLHNPEVTSDLIGAGMAEVAREFDPEGNALRVETARLELRDENIDRSRLGKTVRHAVEQFQQNGVSAVQHGNLAELQRAAEQQHNSDVEQLLAAAQGNTLTFQFSPVFHVASGRVEQIQVDPALIGDNISLTPYKIEGYVAEDPSIGAAVDAAIARHLASYAQAPDAVPQGTYMSCTLPLKALLSRDVVASLMTIASTRPILRIHGLDQSLMERARELQTLRSAGFLVCLYGYEVGAVNEEKLKSLPMDFVAIDSQLTGDKRAFASRIPVLRQMSTICAKYQIRMLFQEISDLSMLPMLREIDGCLAAGPVFDKTMVSAHDAAAMAMPA